MHRTACLPNTVLAACLLSACGNPPPAPTPAADTPAPAPSPVAQSWLDYRCEDGSTVGVRYAENSVELLIEGDPAQLPKAQSASKGVGDAYVGANRSLYREGERIQIHSGDGAPLICMRR